MSFKQRLIAINRWIGWLQVKILTPLLLGFFWILLMVSSLIPRLLGSPFLPPFRRGGETHWTEHPAVDTSLRGLKRQG